MPISTFDELRDTIIDWALPGGEPNFVDQVPTFIRMAEARFDRELEVQNAIGTSIVTTSEAYPGWPPDWLATISISESGGGPLKQLTIVQAEAIEACGPGVPIAYAIVDGGVRLVPAPSAARSYRLTYERKLHRLGDTVQSNWLLAVSPDLYLYASLVAAEVYLKNDERFPLWEGKAQQIIDDMNLQSRRQKYGQGRPLTRVATFG